MDLAEATRQYQVALEYVRADPSPEPDDLDELEAAERQMNAAWLRHVTR